MSVLAGHQVREVVLDLISDELSLGFVAVL